jgi:hypothetical protein
MYIISLFVRGEKAKEMATFDLYMAIQQMAIQQDGGGARRQISTRKLRALLRREIKAESPSDAPIKYGPCTVSSSDPLILSTTSCQNGRNQGELPR